MSMPEQIVSRQVIVDRARAWIGTPYHHQASLCGVGTDCIGLVRGLWRELYGREPEALPGYRSDWAEATGKETLLEAARRHFVEIAPCDARQGDLLAFRYRRGFVAKHVGILVAPVSDTPMRTTFIHATEGAPVAEVMLAAWWQRRLAGAFSFPGISD
ncbi:MAG: NlpC/P60 family protein [Hyphomicrobiaceae bacterium]